MCVWHRYNIERACNDTYRKANKDYILALAVLLHVAVDIV